MRMTPNEPTPKLSVDALLELASEWASKAGDGLSTDMCHVKVMACLDIARIKLTTAEQEIRTKQIELAREGNSLSERLLKSNEDASKQDEANAKLMNSATEQLANSTKSLKWATWALVAFTGVQALIAILALYKK
jgi:hypothetical protein